MKTDSELLICSVMIERVLECPLIAHGESCTRFSFALTYSLQLNPYLCFIIVLRT